MAHDRVHGRMCGESCLHELAVLPTEIHFHGATGATIGVDRAGNPVVVREPTPAEAPPRLGHDASAQAADAGGMVDLRQVSGPVHASLLGQVARAIEANPEDAVRVVRGWLHGS